MADEPQALTTSPPSVPPAVRVITARGQAVQLVIAQVAELVGLVAITYALCIGKLSEQVFGYLFCFCLSGRFAQHVGGAIRGRPITPGTTSIVSVAALCVVAGVLGLG